MHKQKLHTPEFENFNKIVRDEDTLFSQIPPTLNSDNTSTVIQYIRFRHLIKNI